MCDTVFTIGQRGGYHFECPSTWSHGLLPPALFELFKTNKVSSVHSLSLGASNSFFISYLSKTDNRTYSLSESLPDELHSFIYEKSSTGQFVRNFPNIRIALGPYNDSWFATDGRAFRWSNLPATLNDAIKNRLSPEGNWIEAPRIAVLGTDDNYVLISGSKNAAWNLPAYPALNSLIVKLRNEGNGINSIKSIFLNPYRYNSHIMLFTNGSLKYSNMPPHALAHLRNIEGAILVDTEKVHRDQDRLKQQKIQVAATLRQDMINSMLNSFGFR